MFARVDVACSVLDKETPDQVEPCSLPYMLQPAVVGRVTLSAMRHRLRGPPPELDSGRRPSRST